MNLAMKRVPVAVYDGRRVREGPTWDNTGEGSEKGYWKELKGNCLQDWEDKISGRRVEVFEAK